MAFMALQAAPTFIEPSTRHSTTANVAGAGSSRIQRSSVSAAVSRFTRRDGATIVHGAMENNTGTPSKQSLAGLRTLIVGGSGGIGYAVARAAASAGALVTVHGHDPERLASKAATLRELGGEVSTICADLSEGEVPESLLDAARSSDVVVFAYGPFVYKTLAMTEPADWRLVTLACLALPGMVASAAAISMAGRGFGRILLFGGTRTDAIRGFKSNAAYAAAKTGLGVVAKSIATEFGPRGVSCAVLCPGFVDTEYLDPAMKAQLTEASPRGGLIPSAELASLACYLVSGGMDLANGAIIVADRGLHAL
jgi:NAD(P)-dependent dehydrogenase (short-subunit alcohol dehydrogenase family)